MIKIDSSAHDLPFLRLSIIFLSCLLVLSCSHAFSGNVALNTSGPVSSAYIVPTQILSGMNNVQKRQHIEASFSQTRVPGVVTNLFIGDAYYVIPNCNGQFDWSKLNQVVTMTETFSVNC